MRFFLAALFFASAAFASPSGVVISGFQVRGPAGGNDEYIELQNRSSVNVDISGWTVGGCAQGSPGNLSTRATVGANIILAPGQYYLFTNSASGGYSGTVPGDATYGTGVSDFTNTTFPGIALTDAGGLRQDGVGSPVSPCREGTGIVTPTTNGNNRAFVRTQDTNNNAADFAGPQSWNPHNSGGIVVQCLLDGKRIFEIQGRGHVSPFNNKIVCGVPGIVTQVAFNGFYMQDGDGDNDPATSDGIFVFTSTAPTVSVGQQVKVKGTVSEFRPNATVNLTVTEIGSPVVTPATGLFTNTVITPVVIGNGGRIPPNRAIDDDTAGSVEVASQTVYNPTVDGIDFYEALEGMQVRLNNARVVGPINSFGEVWTVGDNGANATGTNARGGITIGENDYNPERVLVDVSFLTPTLPLVSVGDTIPVVVGAMSYSRGNFRIEPPVMPTIVSGGLARATASVASGIDRLRIASYNVENLDANDADTCDGAPDRDLADGRFARIAQQIVGRLLSPDVIGIEELQDDSGCANNGIVSADLTLSTLLAAIAAEGGPAYAAVQVSPANNTDGGAPGANIRQGILYNPARVTFVPGTQGAGNATTATAVSRDSAGRLQLSHSPGRIAPASTAWNNSRKPLAATFDFNGRRLLVIVNHFNSKGGDEPLFGRFQPPILDTEAQRVQQAQVEHDFIAQALALDANARIVTLGDFNDFEFSAPMKTLTGAASGNAILTDLASALLPPAERYSYVFEGNSQELDHIFVTGALLPGAEFQAVHINAEFADQVSDHDPLVASLRILPPPPVADAGPDLNAKHLTDVVLDGSASRAGDGTALTYEWVQIASTAHGASNPGASTATLTGANTAKPTLRTPAEPGELVFSLTVTDRFGMQATDTVSVKVLPGKPGG